MGTSATIHKRNAGHIPVATAVWASMLSHTPKCMWGFHMSEY